MNVSINPSYFCNFRCSFCYLTPTQLGSRAKASIRKVGQRLQEIKDAFGAINHVDLYGGEIFLLPKDYLEQLFDLIHRYVPGSINVISNLSIRSSLIEDPRIYLSVSYDFTGRELSQKVFNHMSLLERPFSVLVLGSKEVLGLNPDECIQELNLLKNLESVEIKPYSSNQSNQQNVGYDDYEKFVRGWISSPIKKNFKFINEEKIIESIKGSYNAFSDDHIYITPTEKFAVLEFDDHDNEYFLELESIDEYIRWSKGEKKKVHSGDYCSQCKYLGHCLTEHYKEVRSLENSCNGFYNLLEWYSEAQ